MKAASEQVTLTLALAPLMWHMVVQMKNMSPDQLGNMQNQMKNMNGAEMQQQAKLMKDRQEYALNGAKRVI